MWKKGVLAFFIIMAMLLVSSNVSESQSDYFEEWVPYVPYKVQVDLEFWMRNQTAYIDITITFSTSCYNISSWGEVTKDGYILWVNSEIWKWTGICAQVIWSVSHTYELGYLESGNYTFTFKAWSVDVKSIDFTVTAAEEIVQLLLLETDKDEYLLGESVNFTLTNISNETVLFGGFPFCEVYAWPSWEPVAPEVFIYLAWSLDPGQSSSWTWNQTNGYTGSPVEAGLYFAKDIYGYNCTTFFKIRATTDPILGDINEDGIVDMRDISIAARAFGSYPGHPRWNPIADINGDNKVCMRDIATVARNFGKTAQRQDQ